MSGITSTDVPAYDELARVPGLGMPHSWDFFGRGDAFGTLNYLTPEVVAAAADGVRDGVPVSLALPVDEPSPPLFGREPLQHEYFQNDRNTWDERLDAYFPQGSSQWDGFRHVRAREHGFFGGIEGDPSAESDWLGMDQWARRGVVGRGLLLDVAAHLLGAGDALPCDEERALEPGLLEEVAEAQGVTVEHGDVLLVRTGWPAKYAALDLARRTALASAPTFPGLHAGEETARLVWDWHVSALVTDVPAVEPVPGDPKVGSLHRRLIPLLGLPLAELFDLERLSRQCQARETWTFMFVAAPMNLPGGCGSPANALAIL